MQREAAENGSSPTFDIAAALAAEDADFISLHDLLTALAAAGNASYQNAGRLLLRKLRNTDGDERPSWCRVDIDHGLVALSNSMKGDSDAWDCLRQAAENGEPQNPPPEDAFDDDIPF